MNYILGFLPDEESNYKIRKVIGEVGMVFDDFGIPVRWVKPQTYHVSLYYLGSTDSFIKRFFLKRKLSKIQFPTFDISLGNVKVGISRSYRELIYIDLKEGGEQLRELLLKVRKTLGGDDVSMFVPHLTIGRINKDLSDEERRNVIKDIGNISGKLDTGKIKFRVNAMYYIESKYGAYSLRMKFDALP